MVDQCGNDLPGPSRRFFCRGGPQAVYLAKSLFTVALGRRQSFNFQLPTAFGRLCVRVAGKLGAQSARSSSCQRWNLLHCNLLARFLFQQAFFHFMATQYYQVRGN